MIQGAGLGLRRDITEELVNLQTNKPAFLEFAPENWMGMGGFWRKQLEKAAEEYPLVCHGLSLSLGSDEALDWNFLKQLKQFFNEFPVIHYSEHLSFSKCQNAHFYDLLPIPFREDAVQHVVERIKQVQDFLGRKIAIENVSYYTTVAPEMDESTFIRSIVEEADCHLLLDVNNVYVNAFNHGFDAREFIRSLPLERVSNIHMAGHEKVSPDLIIDTHGQPIIDPVYDLFEWTIKHLPPVPVLLERDFNIPEIEELQTELGNLSAIMEKQWEKKHVALR
ncbi:HvfB family MNIO-type RiPP peptide maturase [Calditrichota bacterium LG25]